MAKRQNTRNWLLLSLSGGIKMGIANNFPFELDNLLPAPMDRGHFFFLLQTLYNSAMGLLWIMIRKFNLYVLGVPSCITQILSSWVFLMLGRLHKIVTMKVLCQSQSSLWKLLLRTASLSAKLPCFKDLRTFQGLFTLPGVTSALFECSSSFLQQRSLHGECTNYQDRVIEVSAVFTSTPLGFQCTNTPARMHSH